MRDGWDPSDGEEPRQPHHGDHHGRLCGVSPEDNRGPVTPLSVEVWIARATSELAAAWSGALEDGALCELRGFREVERNRRIVQLALRRSVVAARLRCPLRDIIVAAAPTGAMAPPSPTMAVSASHHDDLTVLAFAERRCALGVDVEPLHEPGWDDAVDEVLGEHELEALTRLPLSERPAAYFTCWTLKEAVLKALGQGLSDRDPKSIEIAVPPLPPRLVSLDGIAVKEDWGMETLVFGQHVCSLAAVGARALLTQVRCWPVDLPPPID